MLPRSKCFAQGHLGRVAAAEFDVNAYHQTPCIKKIFFQGFAIDNPIIECRMIEEQAKACWLCRAE